MFKRMRFYLRKLARRALNDLAKAGRPIPEIPELTDALATYVWDEFLNLIYVPEAGGQGLGRSRFRYLNGDDGVQRVAASAARYTLEHWSADYIQEQQRRGAAGGRRSHRGPSKATPDNRAALAGLSPGLTRAQQAQALGISESTVKRLLRPERISGR